MGVGSVAVAFAAALIMAVHHFGGAPGAGSGQDVVLGTWVASGTLHVPLGFWLDGLTTVFLLVITGVGLLIHAYSVGYMGGEEPADFRRYFGGMNLFVGAMLLLVLADSLPLLLIGWAGVGFASYLLIGFWYQRPEAVLAARKAFVLNAVGDAALILAIALLFARIGQVSYAGLFGAAGRSALAAHAGATFWIGLLLFVAAAAKSAQLPLQSWLSDAMEGPTPVSALIHAATMVTAGVYLIARMHVVYAVAPAAGAVAGDLGAITALGAATAGCFAYDIKRVLAYSTMSQVGYMVAGVSFGFLAAGVSHVVTHAFFKAALFMSVGLVMHAVGDERDMRRYGGLAKRLPVARWAFLAGALALAGVPPFGGFWSKDAVMGDLLSGGHIFPYILLALGALLTPFYAFRAYYLTFAGERRGKQKVHAEAGGSMRWPTIVLAVLAVIGGGAAILVQRAWGQSFDWTSMGISTVLALIGWGAAWSRYRQGGLEADAWAKGPLGELARREYGWEALWQGVLVRPAHLLAAGLLSAWEQRVWRGAQGAVAGLATVAARGLSLWQSGLVRRYALTMFCGVALILIYALATAR